VPPSEQTGVARTAVAADAKVIIHSAIPSRPADLWTSRLNRQVRVRRSASCRRMTFVPGRPARANPWRVPASPRSSRKGRDRLEDGQLRRQGRIGPVSTRSPSAAARRSSTRADDFFTRALDSRRGEVAQRLRGLRSPSTSTSNRLPVWPTYAKRGAAGSHPDGLRRAIVRMPRFEAIWAKRTGGRSDDERAPDWHLPSRPTWLEARRLRGASSRTAAERIRGASLDHRDHLHGRHRRTDLPSVSSASEPRERQVAMIAPTGAYRARRSPTRAPDVASEMYLSRRSPARGAGARRRWATTPRHDGRSRKGITAPGRRSVQRSSGGLFSHVQPSL
jgi:hypothetical protein